MKQITLALGFSALALTSVAHADLNSDLFTICIANANMTEKSCNCQISAMIGNENVDKKFLNAMVDGIKNKDTEPLMRMMQKDQEGANKFGEQLNQITKDCGK